jgi:hypothetical protein
MAPGSAAHANGMAERLPRLAAFLEKDGTPVRRSVQELV